ncbi:AAA family ATPase [Candidatus Cardinium sp. TP]|uniref:AAA family ATPase n=1 Tax=Candidatus Cardinium sp. TP TaxID=2961955 RepID=UPI0021AFEE9F|nr:AAA family ATPase [Candidatus Cardinium sp. TP]MCT4697360.1 AAA family ATPase [Candidatus Cardinium sp. TP]
MIYVIGGIKGGSGKSTIATNLAVLMAKEFKDILLIDADDQQSASDFTVFRGEAMKDNLDYTLIQLSDRTVRDQTMKLRSKYDHIIIDTGGRDTTSQRAAISIADIYLVPFVPRSFDIWTIEKVSTLIEEMRIINPKLKSFSFINKSDFSGQDNSEAANLLKENKTLEFIDIFIGNRKSFPNASSKGLAITEIKPKDVKAIQEFNTLFNFLINIKLDLN